MIAVDAERGFEEDWQIKPWLAGAHPYGAWLDGGPRQRFHRIALRAAGGRA